MLKEEDVRAIERVEKLLSLLKFEGDTIFKIIDLVREHNAYFNVKLGGSCLQAAAAKLEQLVKEKIDE